MYLDFFGLREAPFELTPNPKFLFMTSRHREALSNLQYGLSSRKAVTLVIGEVGTGKTTLLQAVLESELCNHVECVYINNPTLTRAEFVETLAHGFALSSVAATSKASLLAELRIKLQERCATGGALALVVDEAQSMSDELLEEIRLLANLETAAEKLLPVVLTGQPELAERLRQPHLRQLHQRVSLRCEIGAFSPSDTASYIAHRIRLAGGQPLNLFTREAVTLIHERSSGLPRTINVLCDNALVGAFAAGVRRVNSKLIDELSREFDLAIDDAPHATAGVVRFPAPGAAPAKEVADTISGPEWQGPPSPPSRELFGQFGTRRRFSFFR